RRLEVLGEYGDGGVGMSIAQPPGGADTLVGSGGRHANVGQDHVRVVRVDEIEETAEILAHGHELEVVLELDQGANSLAHEHIVFCEDEPKGHGSSVPTTPSW